MQIVTSQEIAELAEGLIDRLSNGMTRADVVDYCHGHVDLDNLSLDDAEFLAESINLEPDNQLEAEVELGDSIHDRLVAASLELLKARRKRDTLIRECKAAGLSLRDIAGLAGISHQAVSNIL